MDLYVYEPDGVCRETDERIVRTEYHPGKKWHPKTFGYRMPLCNLIVLFYSVQPSSSREP